MINTLINIYYLEKKDIMAETKQGTNWADMEHEEEDDQEIGVQKKETTGAATEESKKTEESAQEGATQGTEEGKDG